MEAKRGKLKEGERCERGRRKELRRRKREKRLRARTVASETGRME